MVLEKTLESPLDFKKIQPDHPKDQFWVSTGRTDVEAETPILWPHDLKSWLIGKTWCWERLRAGGEGDKRGWDGWMASLTRWTWVWVDYGSWWWTACRAAVHGVSKSQTQLSNSTELNWNNLSVKTKTKTKQWLDNSSMVFSKFKTMAVVRKNSFWADCVLCYSNYIAYIVFWKMQNCGDSKKIYCCNELVWKGDGQARTVKPSCVTLFCVTI